MATTANSKAILPPSSPVRPNPGKASIGAIGWMRQNLFNSWFNTLLTLLIAAVVLRVAPGAIEWLIINASFGPSTSEECRVVALQDHGACWGSLWEKGRFILFGQFPYEDQWRAAIACVAITGAMIISGFRAMWRPRLIAVWAVALFVFFWMMGGGLGLEDVPTNFWNGLPLTLMLAVFGSICSFPIAVLVALGRRSSLPFIKVFCVLYVELIRGVPLITVLFMASFMFPLFLPEGLSINNLLRAQIGIILFTAAYLAEVVRGGLQAIPKGQYEAADALGLGYWKKTMLIILPQALKICIPPIVNSIISMFKDTSLVLIIGLFDILALAKASHQDPPWALYFGEFYIFVALIYFCYCFSMSKYSQWLERKLNRGNKH